MDKSLFKEYEEWCVKNNKDPLKEETVREFKLLKEKEEQEKLANSEEENRKELVAKQEEIFAKFCEYCGVKTKYNADYMFKGIDALIKSVVMESVKCNHDYDTYKVLKKLLGQKGERI